MDPVIVGNIRAVYVRSRGKRGPHDGRVYWRAWRGRETVWVGWATPVECARALAGVLRDGVPRPRVLDITTVRGLLDYWVGTEIDGDTRRKPATVYAIRGRPPRAGERDYRYGGAVGRLIRDLGDVVLDRLTLDTMTDWRRRRLARPRGGSPNMLRLDLVYLQAAWTWGRGIGATPDRELPEIDIPRRNVRERRTPTTAEVARVARWLRDHAPAWAMAILLLQAATGARIGELAHLRWCDVDGEGRAVRVDGKTGPRTIRRVRADVLAAVHRLRVVEPIAGHVARRRDRADDVVWGVSPHTADQVGRYVDQACEALGIERWTSHGIRRMCVNTAIRAGVEVSAAADLFGHSPAVMWQHYRELQDEDRERAAEVAALGIPVDDADVIPMSRRGREPR